MCSKDIASQLGSRIFHIRPWRRSSRCIPEFKEIVVSYETLGYRLGVAQASIPFRSGQRGRNRRTCSGVEIEVKRQDLVRYRRL